MVPPFKPTHHTLLRSTLSIRTNRSETVLSFPRHRTLHSIPPPKIALAPHPEICPTIKLLPPAHRLNQINQHLHCHPAPHSRMSSLPTGDRGYHSNASSTYTARKLGAPNTLDHRIFIEKDGVPISPFHDIPLYANEQQTVLNMVVEIPRWTNAKVEVSARDSRASREAHVDLIGTRFQKKRR